ncbi:MAG: fluoride efflux transporter CrcB [Fimbriimonas sp.]
MNALQQSLLVFLGAGVGANARYWLSVLISSKWQAFPWSTLTINVTGSLLLGLLLGYLDKHAEGQAWRLLLGVGLLGGYTTFSTFSMEAVQMVRSGESWQALVYVVGSCLLGFGVAYWGYSFARG